MTSTDLVVQSTAYSRANLTERERYVTMLAKAGDLLPSNLQQGMVRDAVTGQMVKQGSIGKTFLLAETGDMLGIHPIAAMTGVHIIEGKPSISANLMSGLVRKAGHKLRVSVIGALKDKSLTATAELIRSDDPDFTFKVVWTLEKAERALLYPGKAASNWQKYPEAMLKARALSEVIREGASDVLMGGNVYTPEELGVAVDEQGEPVELQQVPDVSRETSQGGTPEPRPETPIVDEPAAPAEEFDWAKAIAEAQTKADITDLWRKASGAGLMTLPLKMGRARKERPLGDILTEVGQAFAKAEAEAAAADDNVVDAEVVEDDGPAVLADEAPDAAQ